MEENTKEEVRKHKYTLFLERNEIWFKTILSLAVTVAALGVSIASYSVASYQAKLSASVAESQKQEKQPYFSVENYYDSEKEQYIYGIVNTGGEIRDCSITVFPFLHIYQQPTYGEIEIISPLERDDNLKDEYLNHSFIYLPHFYHIESQDNFENGLFSFSDVYLEVSEKYPVMKNGKYVSDGREGQQLTDSYFRDLVSKYNVDKVAAHMNSQIVYYVEILYGNYENELKKEIMWLGRSSDLVHDIIGNVVLLENDSLIEYYDKAKENECILTIDSLNKPVEDVLRECEEYIEGLFEKFGQVPEDGF